MSKVIGVTVGTTINPDKQHGNSNIRNGEGEGSVEFGKGSKALSPNSISGGTYSTSGVKGYYIKAINFSERKILLDTETKEITPHGPPKTTTEPITPTDDKKLPYSVGKYIGILDRNYYIFLTTIEAIEGNVITYAGNPYSIGFSSFKTYPARIDCMFFVPEEPDKGIVLFTGSGVSLGSGAKASEYALSVGDNTIAQKYGMAVGKKTVAGYGARASGLETKAYGLASSTDGYGTVAKSRVQHVDGKWNVPDDTQKYARIVGNGTDDENRSNAYTLDWEGNAWYAGTIYNDIAERIVPFAVKPAYYVNHGASGLVFVYENNDEFPGFTKGDEIYITLEGKEYVCKINSVWDESDPGRFDRDGQYGIRVNINNDNANLIPDSSALYTTYDIVGTKLEEANFYTVMTRKIFDSKGTFFTNIEIPVDDGDAVPKKYVDVIVANLKAKIEALERTLKGDT